MTDDIINPQHKELMIKQGAWARFVDYREELRESGKTDNVANYEAVNKFLGSNAASTACSPDKLSPLIIVTPDKPTNPSIEEDKENPKNREPNKEASMIGSIPRPLPLISVATFKNKPEVSEVDNIKWVCDNMRIVNVSAKDCPSLRAWNLLCECRESPQFRIAFWKDHYGKIIPAKTNLESDKGKGGPDGTPTVKLIGRIQKAAERAEKAEGKKKVSAG